MFPFNQLQSWPTPEMFIRRSDSELIELGSGNLALQSLVNVMPQSQTVTESSPATAWLALVSLTVNGPMTQVETDTGNSSLALQSVVFILPMQEVQTDTGNVSLALQSMVNVTPQSRTETEATPPTATLALQSLVIP